MMWNVYWINLRVCLWSWLMKPNDSLSCHRKEDSLLLLDIITADGRLYNKSFGQLLYQLKKQWCNVTIRSLQAAIWGTCTLLRVSKFSATLYFHSTTFWRQIWYFILSYNYLMTLVSSYFPDPDRKANVAFFLMT